jgi:hypothetical protein
VVVDGSATGSIYDLGYRGYQGPRLGRRHAVGSLVRQSFRQCWGLGRPGRAKVVPFGLAAIATVPAVVALGVAALAQQLGAAELMEEASPIRYDSYFPLIANVVFLFAAAQAPELLARDMRHRVLALFFGRAIRREDYALGKLAALCRDVSWCCSAGADSPAGAPAADIPAAIAEDPPTVPAIPPALLTAGCSSLLRSRHSRRGARSRRPRSSPRSSSRWSPWRPSTSSPAATSPGPRRS